jgi:hypothetical protein
MWVDVDVGLGVAGYVSGVKAWIELNVAWIELNVNVWGVWVLRSKTIAATHKKIAHPLGAARLHLRALLDELVHDVDEAALGGIVKRGPAVLSKKPGRRAGAQDRSVRA